jgi:hypothetical protein
MIYSSRGTYFIGGKNIKCHACPPSFPHVNPQQRGMIAREGRLILIKTVVAAKPIHQMLVAEAPMWLLEEIEKWQRGFFWTAKDSANGGQCLVTWNSVCKPYEFGGLGVKNLRLHGVALRVRWE